MQDERRNQADRAARAKDRRNERELPMNGNVGAVAPRTAESDTLRA
jgi:hypothetical protein